jgi:protein-tyrosine-phosphatase
VNLQGGSSFTTYIYTNLGLIPQDQGFEGAARVMEALGLNRIEIDRKSAEPYEEQFWNQYDVIMELSEDGLNRELPAFVTDPTNKAKVDALIAGRKG